MIVTIANQKGGVGKTTTAITLGHALAIQGHNTLIIDLDPQGQCAIALGLKQTPGIMDWIVHNQPLRAVCWPTARPRLTLLPGDKSTASAAIYLNILHQGATPLDLIDQLLQPALHAGLDHVIIDTAPSASQIQAAALYASHLVIIPASCDHLAADGARATLDTISLIEEGGNRDFVLLPTFYDGRTNESKRMLREYQSYLPDNCLSPITVSTRLRECAAAGKTIWEVEPDGRAATEYAAVVWRVVNGKET
jgi:chromosome partitioning protein